MPHGGNDAAMFDARTHAGKRSFHAGALRGTVRVPGDKSISHRALILAALSTEAVSIRNLNPGSDVAATINALRSIGAAVSRAGQDSANAAPIIEIRGGSFHDPSQTIDCMNSGSTARMLMGVCAGANLRAVLDGDESLRRRPMEPVAAQLRAFGARIETSEGKLPATVRGTAEPQTRTFILLSPSAQVKTALLFGGVFAGVDVTVLGDKGSRDHTERLLKFWGADLSANRERVDLRSGPREFKPVDVAGDFSAAAFFIVAATVAPGSAVHIPDVGVNPLRTGLLDALRMMGADIRIENERERCGEPIADIVVRASALRGGAVSADVALRAIDEIPVLGVAAAFADGVTRITGVRELRNKESDRVAAIARLLHAAGIEVETLPDGISITGGAPRTRGETLETAGDHRTVMAAAALAAGAGELSVDDASAAEVSFPDFLETLQRLQRAA